MAAVPRGNPYEGKVARLRIELRRTKPKICRRFDVPLAFTRTALHHVIHALFGWCGWHLWVFLVGGREFSEDQPDDPFGWEPELAANFRLGDFLDWGVKRFDYLFDFGDDWAHLITLVRVLDADASVDYPALLAGARAAPQDGIGGVWGFYSFLEACRDPDHPRRKDYEERVGQWYMENFDPEKFDEESVRNRLSDLWRSDW